MFCALCFVTILLLTGCAFHFTPESFVHKTMRSKGWFAVTFASSGFKLQGFHNGLRTRQKEVLVYIEGDGNAWIGRHSLSANPTPRNSLILKLATQDPSPQVFYLARPCQYIMSAKCHPKYWSSHRFSEIVVASMVTAIDQIKALARADTVNLVGYSGGGALAVLIGSRRNDIGWLVTVAANLDHKAWTQHHNASPLTGSLSALDVATKVAMIPQLHFIGSKDRVMPQHLFMRYADRLKQHNTIILRTIRDYDHKCCWQENWQGLLCRHLPWKQHYCSSQSKS